MSAEDSGRTSHKDFRENRTHTNPPTYNHEEVYQIPTLIKVQDCPSYFHIIRTKASSVNALDFGDVFNFGG